MSSGGKTAMHTHPAKHMTRCRALSFGKMFVSAAANATSTSIILTRDPSSETSGYKAGHKTRQKRQVDRRATRRVTRQDTRMQVARQFNTQHPAPNTKHPVCPPMKLATNPSRPSPSTQHPDASSLSRLFDTIGLFGPGLLLLALGNWKKNP